MLDVPEVMRCVLLLCMPEAVESGLCVLVVLDVLDAPAVMRCVLICMLEAVESELSFEVLKLPLWQFSRSG